MQRRKHVTHGDQVSNLNHQQNIPVPEKNLLFLNKWTTKPCCQKQGMDSFAEIGRHSSIEGEPEESPEIIVADAEIAPPRHVLVQLQFLFP
jgi:hypothetical protein